MATKKYKVMKYLSPVEVSEITKTYRNFSILNGWHKTSEFGFKYYFTRLKRFDADRKKNVAFLVNAKPKETVYLCKAKDKYWISLVYGYKEYLNSPLVLKYAGLWFDNPKEWGKLCKEISVS